MLEIFQDRFGEELLEVEAVLVSEGLAHPVGKLLKVGYRKVDPVILVGPGGRVGEHLRLATTSLAPKEHARVVAFESREARAAMVFGTPVVIAELVVSLHV